MKKLLILLIIACACQGPEVAPPAPVYPIPSEHQLAWHDLEYYGFVHFNMNTFSDMEWGMGDENPADFNPTELDAHQWAKVAKEAGMKGIIITAKHHDGFCLWPSAYTEHSVKNSPWRNGKGDLIQELREACDEFGLEMGIYYSPWDRNHAAYGTPEYITYMRNQLTELLSNYGDIFEVWFDGANGGTGYYGGANENRYVDKLTYYDWPNTYALVRELQPGAVMFSDGGPDVRWVGNEEGFAYETTWSNLMRDSVYAGMPEYPEKYASGQEDGTHWVPAEADVSIRPGWYYHEYEDHKVKTLPQLLDIYYNSIGRNAALLINFPVDRRGLIHEKDIEQIMKLSTKIKEDFAVDLAQRAKLSASNERGRGFEIKQVLNEDKNKYWAAEDGVIHNEILIQFLKNQSINRFLVQEHIALGQRVKAFTLEAKTAAGWELIHSGTTIGAKRILRFEDVETDALKFTITDAKASPTLSRIGVYHAPQLLIEPMVKRDKSGAVTLHVPGSNVDIYYTLDGSNPAPTVKNMKGPIMVDQSVELRAISHDPATGQESEVLVLDLDIAKAKWKVIHSDSNAEKAIDEDPSTFWQSTADELTVDLGEVIMLYGFTYLPPQNRYMRGIINRYVFQTSMDGRNWTDRALGEFSNIYNNPIEQTVRFDGMEARYIRLKALGTTDGLKASFAELGVITRDN
jgi:alpha-L-fucosidase